MRLIISDFNLNIHKRYDQADFIPRVGDRIVVKEGNWRVVDVAWMYDLDCPNVTVTVEKIEFHGYYASLGNDLTKVGKCCEG